MDAPKEAMVHEANEANDEEVDLRMENENDLMIEIDDD